MVELLQWEAELCGWSERMSGRWGRTLSTGSDVLSAGYSPPTHADLRPELLRLAAEAGGEDADFRPDIGRHGVFSFEGCSSDPLTYTDDALALARAVGMDEVLSTLTARIMTHSEWAEALEPERMSHGLGAVAIDAKDNSTIARTLTCAAIEAAGVHHANQA